jgi:hypothetical protein
MSRKPRGIAFYLFLNAIVHIGFCAIYFLEPEGYERNRYSFLVLPIIIFGPLYGAVSIYWRFLRGSKRYE